MELIQEKFFSKGTIVKLAGIVFLNSIMIGFALFPTIGYETDVEIAHAGTLSDTGLQGQRILYNAFKGSIKIDFNPLLYPFSYLAGSSSISKRFMRFGESYDVRGEEVVKMVSIGVVFPEFLRNVPYFIIMSLVIVLGLRQLTWFFKARKLPPPQFSDRSDKDAPILI